MGFPVSVALSELFMDLTETATLSACPPEIRPSFYGRYIDDILLITETKESFNAFHQHMNQLDGLPTLQFTKEEEENSKLPFLDL